MYKKSEAHPNFESDIEVSSHLFNSGSRKADTEKSRLSAVMQAISMMRAHFQDRLTLQEIASSAQLSAFHFNRIFRSITGIPPNAYLAALRIEEAKKLLLSTNLNITSICLDVGYYSLGTFTTRFTQFVGITPTHFRQISWDKNFIMFFQDWDTLKSLLNIYNQCLDKGVIEGSITIAHKFDGLIFIGLFTDPIPQKEPISCTILTEPGKYSLPSVPEGKYYLFATAMQRPENRMGILENRSPWCCSKQQPIVIPQEFPYKPIDLTLRPICWADPPILIALPWLLFSRVVQLLNG